ncbi:hypothetical protein SDC9_34398 [bioreactor metagenome]|uniref:Uncharacterized protein n=1 Tax=bioreactor metagenome TaxID=1076179 RepID=A0A644VAN5_9ZZZZ
MSAAAGLLACGSGLGRAFPGDRPSGSYRLRSPLTVAGAAAALPEGAPHSLFIRTLGPEPRRVRLARSGAALSSTREPARGPREPAMRICSRAAGGRMPRRRRDEKGGRAGPLGLSPQAAASGLQLHLPRPVAQHEFLHLAGRGLRQLAEHHRLRRLEMRHVLPAEGDELLVAHLRARAQLDEGAGRLAPAFVRAGDDGRFHHFGVLVEHVLDLDRGDVLAARDDDVLRAVLQLDIAIGVHHPEVARGEPAAGKGLVGGGGVLEVPLHHVVAAHEDLAHRHAIGRHRLLGVGVRHHDLFHRVVAHALPRLEFRALGQRQPVPFLVPGAGDAGAVGLGQAIAMGDVEAERLHLLDDDRGRRGAAGQHLDALLQAFLHLGGRMHQHRQHHRGAAEMGDALFLDEAIDRFVAHRAQADRDTRRGGDGPGEAPAVAMEHRQRPQVDRPVPHVPRHDIRQRIQMRAAVVIDHALRVAGGARGVVQRDRVPFVIGADPAEIGVALGEQFLIADLADLARRAEGRVGDVDHQQVARPRDVHGAVDDLGEFRVDEDHLAFGMAEDEGHGFGIETGVDRVQHRAGHRHREMRLEHLRDVGRHDRDRVALAVAALRQRRGHLQAARIGLPPGAAHALVDHGKPVRIDLGRAVHQAQRRDRQIVRRGLFAPDVVDVVLHGSSLGGAGQGARPQVV